MISMLKDVNVTQTSELKIFAHSSSKFGEDIVSCCHQGISSGEEAIRSADYYRNFMRRKVEEAEDILCRAERALSDYESQDHTDSEGNSTYDSSYAAALRAAVEEARRKVSSVKEDQQQVEQRFNLVRQEVDSMISALSSSVSSATHAADKAYRQITMAASILEQDYHHGYELG